MKKETAKNNRLARRQKRVRAVISGTAERPRLSVYRSHNHLYAQLIDDASGRTIASAHSRELAKEKTPATAGEMSRRVNIGYVLGKMIAERAAAKNIKAAVFDRAGRKFHGRVAAVARGAREAGLII